MSLEKRKAGLCRYRRKQCRLRRRRVSGPPSRHVREDHAQRRQNRPPHPEGTPGLIGPPFFRSEERRVGKEWSVRVDLGGRRIITKKTRIHIQHTHKVNTSIVKRCKA